MPVARDRIMRSEPVLRAASSKPSSPRTSRIRSIIERLLMQHPRAALAVLLPASFIFDSLGHLRSWYTWRFRRAPERHDERVTKVQEQVRAWRSSGADKPMCTARSPWMTMSPRLATYKRDCSRIELDLRDILDVDV